ncbi:hypothetical protein [Janibacter cremeus]|uniref:PKD domain-containing protein n=1 Tax=Janibacter cremeus TaxID=1285192 RepID=A0A852VTM0_9MICO|nr:hypothetical protein [Janibacter cremeus]NYF96921.1 hypothetical protein [Janibacter cremeus]
MRFFAAICASWLIILGATSTADAGTEPKPKTTNFQTGAHVSEKRITETNRLKDKDEQISGGTSSRTSGKAEDVAWSTPPAKWVTKERNCSSGGLDPACSATIIDCRANPSASGPPRLVWMKQEGSDHWYGPIQTCLPGYPPPPDVDDPTIPRTSAPPPPVPTIAQIREAFMELPFAKPEVSMQPVGNQTLINLPTFYEASWPKGAGLKPGDVSKPVTLLSWTIEFKIASKDYRYDFGDDSTSEWTDSTGGVYPDGDITHTYETTGKRSVKVDARLVGQFRVNGGAWQNLGAVADLQDEPVAQLQVVGTKTRLVDN